ncbi:PAS domain S-box protein, partial [Thermodesulfobacteriota bacterium]
VNVSGLFPDDPGAGTISTVSDESHRKRSEEQLKESEERYRLLTDNSLTGIYIHQGGRFVYVNDRLASMMGYSPEELIGKEFWSFVHSKDRRTVKKRGMARSLGRDAIPRYEFRVLCKNGETKWVEVLAATTMFRGRSANMGNMADVTARKMAEQRLRESEEKYRTIIENIEEVYYEVDLAGNFTFLNDSASKIFGYPKETLLGMNYRQFMKRSDAVKTLGMFNQVFDTGKSVRAFDLKFRGEDGTEKHIEISVSAIKDSQGRTAGFRGICRDIAERKRAEEEIIKLEKLQSIGVLAGGIAHDFNNILTGIQGNISVARLMVPPETGASKRLAQAEESATRARDLTQQLLTFAKGGAPIKRTTSIVNIVEDSCRFALRGSNVRHEFSIAEQVPAVDADEVQISQVIGNLVMNADHAMPQGGIINVEIESAVVGPEDRLPLEAGQYVRISVRDQGEGIPEDKIPNIFDPYFTTKDGGSGLGLAAAYSIVKSHDGLITVDSERGVGTSFHVYLPASDREIQPRETMETDAMTGSAKILLMDDEDAIRDLAQEMLSLLGYEIDTAKDGTEATEIFAKAKESERPFDAVILDLTVPGGMGGRRTMELLLDMDPNVKAIVSSGYSNDPIMADYGRYGFSGVIPKPYNVQQLTAVLRKVIAGDGE